MTPLSLDRSRSPDTVFILSLFVVCTLCTVQARVAHGGCHARLARERDWIEQCVQPERHAGTSLVRIQYGAAAADAAA